VLAVAVGYLVLVPLAILIYSSFKASKTELPFEVHGFSVGNYVRVFSSSGLASVSLHTAIYVVGSLAVAVLITVTLAYLLERTDLPGRRILSGLVLTPMAVPVTVTAIAWALLANKSTGPLALLIHKAFGVHVDVYSMVGMILVTGIFGVPSMYLMVAPAFARLNPELEEAAASFGAPAWIRLRRVVIPLVTPAVSAAGMLLVVIALEGFAIPAILGLPKGIFVYSSLIQYSLQPVTGYADYGRASTYGVLMLLLSIVMVLVYRRRLRDANRFQVVMGKGYRATGTSLGRWRLPLSALVWAYMAVAVVMPVLWLVWTSLSPFARSFRWAYLGDLTFDNYRGMVETPGFGGILVNTAEVVLVTATVTIVVATWLSVAAARRQFPGATFIFEATFLVFAIPSVVLGAAVLFVYLYLPIPIYGTPWIITVALITRFLPRTSRMVQTALLQLDDGLIESARTTGAAPWRVTTRILVPLLRPALARAWLWVFAMALGELPIALLLTSASNRTLVVLLWDQFSSRADYPAACAVAVFLMCISMTVVLVVNRRRSEENL
jgi:iron(III) transport system permease protein